MISNLFIRVNQLLRRRNLKKRVQFSLRWMENGFLLVLILIFESFVDAICDGFAVENEAFCNWRLWI